MHTRWRLLIASLCLMGGISSTHAESPKQTNHNILVVGDSLSAEYGIGRDTGWVQIVQRRLQEEKLDYAMRNASISGDTTSGGLSRMPAALEQHKPAVVIIELGSNDALRGLALDVTQKNLDSMISLAQDAGARVLLVGMHIPANYGRSYTERFHNLFKELAERRDIALVPFLLEGVALNKDLFLDDGLHPNEAAQPAIADNVWAVLHPMLATEPAKRSTK